MFTRLRNQWPNVSVEVDLLKVKEQLAVHPSKSEGLGREAVREVERLCHLTPPLAIDHHLQSPKASHL